MPRLKPDPTFYPSPTLAAQSPPETLAYLALIGSGKQGRPDANWRRRRRSGFEGRGRRVAQGPFIVGLAVAPGAGRRRLDWRERHLGDQEGDRDPLPVVVPKVRQPFSAWKPAGRRRPNSLECPAATHQWGRRTWQEIEPASAQAVICTCRILVSCNWLGAGFPPGPGRYQP
jgi:hypothetical protein